LLSWWVCGSERVMAAHDQGRGDMAFPFGGGGQSRPDARWGAEEYAVCKRCVFQMLGSTVYVFRFGFESGDAEAVGRTEFEFGKAAPLSVYRVV
jgi:hypothetical protein